MSADDANGGGGRFRNDWPGLLIDLLLSLSVLAAGGGGDKGSMDRFRLNKRLAPSVERLLLAVRVKTRVKPCVQRGFDFGWCGGGVLMPAPELRGGVLTAAPKSFVSSLPGGGVNLRIGGVVLNSFGAFLSEIV